MLKTYWKALFFGCCLAIAMNLLFQATPALLGIAVERGISRHNWLLSGTIAGVILGLGMMGAWCFRLRERYECLAGLEIYNATINSIIEKSLSLGSTLSKASATGLSVSIGIEDTSRLSTKIPRVTSYSATALFSLVNCFCIVLEIDARLALISLLSMLFFIVLSFLLFQILKQREHDFLAQSSILTSLAGDIVLGLRILGGIGGQNIFAQNYIRQSRLAQRYHIKQGWYIALISTIANVGPVFSVLIIVYLAGKSVIAGTMPLSKFTVLAAYFSILSWVVWSFIEVFYEIIGMQVSAERIVNLLNIEPEFIDPVLPIVFPGKGKPLYDPVHDITIMPGDNIAIISVDPASAHKLCKDLAYYRADSPCLWGNIPFTQLALADIRSHIMVSEQDDYLFSASVRENILLGRKISAQILEEITIATCCDEIIAILDQGWETQLFDDARNLSGGQRQRLRLARALAAQTEYLFLIDPTSAVDAQVERVIAQNILSFRQNISPFIASTIFTTTSPFIAGLCAEVIFIDAAENMYRGTHMEFMQWPEYFSTINRRRDA